MSNPSHRFQLKPGKLARHSKLEYYYLTKIENALNWRKNNFHLIHIEFGLSKFASVFQR